jgi:hypothetical protein
VFVQIQSICSVRDRAAVQAYLDKFGAAFKVGQCSLLVWTMLRCAGMSCASVAAAL